MSEFPPAGKTSISITTRGLPGLENVLGKYQFDIDLRNMPFILEITGEYRGPDNCEPISKEQEHWFDELVKYSDSGIDRVWSCQWSVKDKIVLRKFLQLLEPFLIETEYN